MSFFTFLYNQIILQLPYPKTSLTGKTFIVTGANVGLGKEAARHLVRLDAAKVILAVRSTSKGDEVKNDIESSTGKKGVVEVWPLDLSSYESVQAFARKAQQLDRIDALVENAGVATHKYSLAEDNESTITVNVVSTFLLALLLLPKLRETAQKYNVLPRLVILTSGTHTWTNFPEKSAPEGQIFNTLNNKEAAGMEGRYPLTKLLEVLIVRELCSRMSQKHPGDPSVVINLVNPGLCHSALARELGWRITIFKFFCARSAEVGSRTEVHAAIEAGVESFGQYMDNCKVSQPSSFARSEEGKEAGRRIYEELMAKLEKIQPGVTANL
jgi:retinol dehydrogenase 12